MMCAKCVLPEYKPDICLNGQGICNICADFERAKNLKLNFLPILESELIKTLNKYRNKGKYNCLVMCSGGKDSTSSLYYMKKRYRINPLAFTFDHGFETEGAMENIRNAVNMLGVDWLYFKSDFMQELFAEIVRMKSKAPICSVCSIWYMQTSYDFAARFRIPLIISGWTRGQMVERTADSNLVLEPKFASITEATSDFIDKIRRKHPKYKNFPKTMKEVQKKYKIMVLSPHWFLQSESEEYVELIKKELKWKPIRLSYPANSTNCYLNFLSVHLSMKYYGFTHYHVEMSKMIRMGLLTRDKALKLLERNYDDKLLASILGKLGCKTEDL